MEGVIGIVKSTNMVSWHLIFEARGYCGEEKKRKGGGREFSSVHRRRRYGKCMAWPVRAADRGFAY